MVIRGPWKRPLTKDEQTLKLMEVYFLLFPEERDLVYDNLICLLQRLQEKSPA